MAFGIKLRRSGVLRSAACAVVMVAGLFSPDWALGQEAIAEPTVEERPAKANPASPRATVRTFLDLARANHYQDAGTLLEIPKSRVGEQARLAQRLEAVLRRHLALDFDEISDAASGALDDGLPTHLENLGSVTSTDGTAEPVRLRRRPDGNGWTFSSATVSRIDSWYERLEGRWLTDQLPAQLLRPGPRELLWWQWLGLLAVAVIAAGLATLSSWVVRRLMARGANRTSTPWDDRLIARTAGPLTLGFWLLFTRSSLPWLLLYPTAERFVHQGMRGLFLANLLWLVWRLVDVAGELSWASQWSHQHPGSRALIPLARRVGKAVVAVAAVILFLSALGYPVTSLIAGLGLGGLALALASQKTVENLFGAFSLGIDQPFREGDFVRIDDLVGTVESLGLRSTKIRTLDRTLVSIPNGKLAEMRLETFAARDRLRLACTIGLVYETTEAQMRAVLGGLEQVLLEHPQIWPDNVLVRFKELAQSSLDIEVMAWFTINDWNEFLLIRQNVLLQFMSVVERAGTSFAFPTRTLHVASGASHGGEG